MGEQRAYLVFGVQEPKKLPKAVSEDDYLHWCDWVEQQKQRGLAPKDGFSIAASYESKPEWLGIEAWSSGDNYVSEALDSYKHDGIEQEWAIFRLFVKAQLGLDLGLGCWLLVSDHT